MKSLRQFLILITSLISIVCIVLLLNFTAPNPTGRRYSSAMPLTTGQAAGGAIGIDGERILAQDLSLPRNDEAGQRQCACNSRLYSQNTPTTCNLCFVQIPTIQDHRRPDFVTDTFIAESKNRQDLFYTSFDVAEQIGDYVQTAHAADKALWLYIRVDTNIDPAYYHLIESTGGGIVRYFTVPGWVDPVDHAARVGLAAFSGVLIGVLYWEWVANRKRAVSPVNHRPHTPTPKPKPTANGKTARTLDRAVKSTQNLEAFKQRVEDKVRREIDENDIWADPS